MRKDCSKESLQWYLSQLTKDSIEWGFIPTNDFWNGPWILNDETKAVFITLKKSSSPSSRNAPWHIHACGTDDDDMGKSYNTQAAAIEDWEIIKTADIINHELLDSLDFERF